MNKPYGLELFLILVLICAKSVWASPTKAIRHGAPQRDGLFQPDTSKTTDKPGKNTDSTNSVDSTSSYEEPPLALLGYDGSRIEAGTFRYRATMKMGERSMDYSVTRTIFPTTFEGEKVWSVVEQSRTPGRTVQDTTYIDRKILIPVRRHVDGPLSAYVTYSDTGAAVELIARGKTLSNFVEYNGRKVLASGSNFKVALTAMSIDKNFSTKVRIFQERRRRIAQFNLKVKREEILETQGKHYNTYLVSVKSENGNIKGNIFVRKKAPHYIIKSIMHRKGSGGTRTVIHTLKSMNLKE